MFKDPARMGRCYELAGRWLMDKAMARGPFGGDAEGFSLVHGSVLTFAYGYPAKRIGHAWVLDESTDRIWEPISDSWKDRSHYYSLVNAEQEATYMWPEASEQMVRTEHWGPWHDTGHHFTGMIRETASSKRLWHLTDEGNFRLDPNFVPEDNAIAIYERTAPGLYLTDNPEKWINGHGYLRPFLVELEVPLSAIRRERWGGEEFLPAENFSQARIVRVIPTDAYARETYGSEGWIEERAGTRFDTEEPVTGHHLSHSGYVYPGPDVRDMAPSLQQWHVQRAQGARKVGSSTKTAAWADVMERAKQIRDDDKVRIISVNPPFYVGHVQGTSDMYQVEMTLSGSALAWWQCGCPWSTSARGTAPHRRRFELRPCKHALAFFWELQSRGMFGRDILEDPDVVDWVDKEVVVFTELDDLSKTRVRTDAADVDPHSFAGALSPADTRPSATEGVRRSAVSTINPEFGYAPSGELFDGIPDHVTASVEDLSPRTAGMRFEVQHRGRVLPVELDDGFRLRALTGEEIDPRDAQYPTWHPTRGITSAKEPSTLHTAARLRTGPAEAPAGGGRTTRPFTAAQGNWAHRVAATDWAKEGVMIAFHVDRGAVAALEQVTGRSLPNAHITLGFFGKVSDHAITTRDLLRQVAAKVASQTGSISGTFRYFDAFPSPDAPKVLWADPGKQSAFAAVASSVRTASSALGVVADESFSRYIAHLTIDMEYDKGPLSMEDLKIDPAIPYTAGTIVLSWGSQSESFRAGAPVPSDLRTSSRQPEDMVPHDLPRWAAHGLRAGPGVAYQSMEPEVYPARPTPDHRTAREDGLIREALPAHTDDLTSLDVLAAAEEAELKDEPEPVMEEPESGEVTASAQTMDGVPPGLEWLADDGPSSREARGAELASGVKETLSAMVASGSISKEALKDFSRAEQEEMIAEGAGILARNLDQLDLSDTHYSHGADGMDEWFL